MISLIVCSVNKQQLEFLKQNVPATIGVEYELLAIDNTIRKEGICKVYNEAAEKAKYPYLCFVHEDVRFWTKNWGQYMIETLQQESAGILGVGGGKYYPHVPGAWLDIPLEMRRLNLVKEVNGKPEFTWLLMDSPDKHLSSVVTLDGVLLAMRKPVWQEFRFNFEVARGFEFYDIEICLRAAARYNNLIDHRILLEHFGTGRYATRKWVTDALYFYDHKTVKHSVSIVDSISQPYLEDFAFKRFLEKLALIKGNKWKFQIMWSLFIRFPGLLIKNIKFYIDIRKENKHFITSRA
jgi:hypothetical protein